MKKKVRKEKKPLSQEGDIRGANRRGTNRGEKRGQSSLVRERTFPNRKKGPAL